MRAALVYGFKRGVQCGVIAAVALLAVRPAFAGAQWVAEQWLLLRHGGGDIWLGI